jgi:hypothetical protein
MQAVNADLSYYFTTTVPPEGLNFTPTRTSIARAPLKVIPITIGTAAHTCKTADTKTGIAGRSRRMAPVRSTGSYAR